MSNRSNRVTIVTTVTVATGPYDDDPPDRLLGYFDGPGLSNRLFGRKACNLRCFCKAVTPVTAVTGY
jgi:hypothetical protein